MTNKEAIAILDPETTMVALLDYVYDLDSRNRIVEEACRMACAALRAQQESEKNDPLTLAELREMDGDGRK